MKSNWNKEGYEYDSHVICVCLGTGFPHGVAHSRRIHMVGKAVIEEGLRFSVLHIGGSPTDINKKSRGIYDGIEYEYIPAKLSRSKNPIWRKILYLWGIILSIFRIYAIRAKEKRICVYNWTGGAFLSIAFTFALRIIRVPSVQEVNEWWPGRMEWFKKFIGLCISQGTITISHTIHHRLNTLCSKYSISNERIRIPVLTEIGAWKLPQGSEKIQKIDSPYVLWCGDIKGYMRDIRFMIQAISHVINEGYKCKLVLIGSKSESVERVVEEYINELGLEKDSIHMTGYITDDDLKVFMWFSSALLLPLWNDDRSQCRFPTKLGEYLSSEKPVITCDVGDLRDFLINEESAFIYHPGNYIDFAEKICAVLQNPKAAISVGKNGKEKASKYLAYQNYSKSLSQFFVSISA